MATKTTRLGQKQLLVFIAAFALLGGAYFVYKSFASTTQYVRVLPASFASKDSKNVKLTTDSLSYLSGFHRDVFLNPPPLPSGGGIDANKAPLLDNSPAETVPVAQVASGGKLNYAALDMGPADRLQDCYIMRALGPTYSFDSTQVSPPPPWPNETKVRISSGANKAEVALKPDVLYNQFCIQYKKPKYLPYAKGEYDPANGVVTTRRILPVLPTVEVLSGGPVNVWADIQSFGVKKKKNSDGGGDIISDPIPFSEGKVEVPGSALEGEFSGPYHP